MAWVQGSNVSMHKSGLLNCEHYTAVYCNLYLHAFEHTCLTNDTLTPSCATKQCMHVLL